MTQPHSAHAEQCVLGGVILRNSTWSEVSEILAASDFYRADHRLIFAGMVDCAQRGVPIDILTVSDALESSRTLEDAGGLAYLATIAKETPSAENIDAYARIVREFSDQRRMIAIGQRISDMASEPGAALMDVAQIAERLIGEIMQGRKAGGEWRDYKTIMRDVVDRVEAAYNRGDAMSGIPTGFTDLDEALSGLQRSDLIIVAGRPSMGKTSMALCIAEHVAIKNPAGPVAVFSMEMPAEHLGMRSISSHGRINSRSVRTGRLEDSEWPRLTAAVNMLAESKLFVDDSPALTPADLRARCRKLAVEHGNIGLVVVDYLQLMRFPGLERDPVSETTAISKSLKALAKEFDCPVIALSQLNRGLEQRPNKRPVMSDLRQSGAIEQDADVIMFVYRDEVYNKDSQDKGIAEIIIGKQRNGPIGTVRLTFQGEYTRFDNFASPYSDNSAC
jgi:replicative DNA helicase